MKTRKIQLLTLLLALILSVALALTACGQSMSDTEMKPTDPSSPGAAYDAAPSEPEYGYDSDYGYANKGDIVAGEKDDTVVGDAAQMSEKIIRNATLTAQTKEFDTTLSAIRAAVASAGGFEETFRVSGNSYYANGVYSRSAYMVLRLPAAELDAFLGTVGNMVNVLSQEANASNVTGEYYDIVSRINVLESERAAYEEMLKKSMDVEYLLKIKDRLYNVIEEIDSYKTRLNLLDSQVAYSTVRMTLNEVIEYTPVVTEESTFGQRMGEAFKTSWQDFGKGCQNFSVWFVAAFPTLLVLAVIAAAIIVPLVLVRRKRKQRLAARYANNDEK